MAIEKNSLSILCSYLGIIICQMLTQKLCWGSQALYWIITIISLGGAFLLWKLNQKFQYHNLIEQKNSTLKRIIGWGFGGIFLVILGQLLTLTLGAILLKQSPASENTTALITIFQHAPIYSLDIVIATPIIEEFVFRKVFFGNLTHYFNIWISAIIASFLFAIAHHDGHFLTYFVMGCILELIYYQAHDLRASMLAHMGLNLITLLIFGLKI